MYDAHPAYIYDRAALVDNVERLVVFLARFVTAAVVIVTTCVIIRVFHAVVVVSVIIYLIPVTTRTVCHAITMEPAETVTSQHTLQIMRLSMTYNTVLSRHQTEARSDDATDQKRIMTSDQVKQIDDCCVRLFRLNRL